MMQVQLINEEFSRLASSNERPEVERLEDLHRKAAESERLRQNFDLRTTPEDGSQRMLNALEVGTRVPIHRHLRSSESVICIEGCLDWVFYDEFSRLASSNERPEVERPNMDAGGPVHNGEVATDESCFVETARFRVCPREGQYGIQVPLGAWHSVVVHEPSTILEAKDGAYGK
jgi:hypothetical protein